MAFGGSLKFKMSDETFDFVCTTCAEDKTTVKAVKYCTECFSYCCQPCTDAHKKFPTLKNHSLLDIDQGQQAGSLKPRFLEVPIQRCRVHKTKVVDLYCEFHDEVGCSSCFLADHKTCKNSHIHSIPDTIDAIFKSKDNEKTYSQLNNAIASMDTVSEDVDTRLQKLAEERDIALHEVDSFETILIAILRNIAESSRNAVKAAYKEREQDILNEKESITNITDDLQTTKDKLDQMDGNRAEHFVSSKRAQTQIKEATNEEMKYQQHKPTSDVKLSFTPDQSLVGYLNSLQSIGQVDKHERRKNNLYKIKASEDIPIKLPRDSLPYTFSYCCLTHDNQLLVTDSTNKKLKRIDTQTKSVVDSCILDCTPVGLCCISDNEVAVACQFDNRVIFVSVDNMRISRKIKMLHKCYGISYKDDLLYVTDARDSLYVYDMSGTCLNTCSQDLFGNNLFMYSRIVSMNEKRDRIYVGDAEYGLVCFDGKGNCLTTINDTELKHVIGACVDGNENVFVVGKESDNVVLFDHNGKKVGVVLKAEDGLKNPLGVCFDKRLKKMYVTMYKSDVVKVFELE